MARQRRRQMSVLFVPDDGSRTRVFKLGYWRLRAAAAALLLLLIMLVLEVAFFWKIREWRQSAQTLMVENSRLNAEVARVEELALMLKRIQGTDQRLRQMLSPNAGLAPAAYGNPTGPQENGTEGAPVATTPERPSASPRDSADAR